MCIPSNASDNIKAAGLLAFEEVLDGNHDNDTEGGSPPPPLLVMNEQGGLMMSNATSLFADNQAARDEVFRSLQDDENNKEQHSCVQHNYHDHANDDGAVYLATPTVTKGGVTVPFPLKLYNMLEHIDLYESELSSIVRWQPHGRCFLVKNSKKFAKSVLPRFFDQRQYASFQRQLNLYGFNRITAGPDKGSYYHELFLRSKKILCRGIYRMKIKGTKTRMAGNPDQEPNFYQMVSLPSSSSSSAAAPKTVALDHSSSPPNEQVEEKEEEDGVLPPPSLTLEVPSRAPATTMRSSSSSSVVSSALNYSLVSKPPYPVKKIQLGGISQFNKRRSEDKTSHASPSSDHMNIVFGNMLFHSIEPSNDRRRHSLMDPPSSSDEESVDMDPLSSCVLDDDEESLSGSPAGTKSGSSTADDDDDDDDVLFDSKIGNFIDLLERNADTVYDQEMSALIEKLDKFENQGGGGVSGSVVSL